MMTERSFRFYFLSRLFRNYTVLAKNYSRLAEIYKAINTKELRVYTDEVTFLRKKGILEDIRTNPQASQYATSKGIEKGQVKRFRVKLP